MDIQEETVNGTTVVTLRGKMDAATSGTVEERLMKLVDGGATRLLVDLSQLDYVSSVGLRVFILAAKRLKTMNGRIDLCAPKPAVKQILQIAGFPTIFKMHDTREAALSSGA